MELEYFMPEARQYRLNRFLMAFHTEEVATLLEMYASTGDAEIEVLMDEHARALEQLGKEQDLLESQIDLNQVTEH